MTVNLPSSTPITPEPQAQFVSHYRYQLSPLPPPHRTLRVSVAIPARDEQESIVPVLSALSRQTDFQGNALDPRSYEVILFANDCRDDTAAIARAFAAHNPHFSLHVIERDIPPPQSHVGTARRTVMDIAYSRLLEVNRPRGIIATTDADTIVDSTWVYATQFEIERGSDVVGGRILVRPGDLDRLEPNARAIHLKDVGYRYLLSELSTLLDPDPFDPWPRHFQHFGASLAVTADAYRAAGGLPVRPSLEDVAMYERLRQIDARIRHSPAVRVWTSARQLGRTHFGFAVQLREWTVMGRRNKPFLVPPPARSERWLHIRSQLRSLWHMQSAGTSISDDVVEKFAHSAGVSGLDLRERVLSQTTFGMQARQLHSLLAVEEARHTPVTIEAAIPQLRARLSELRPKFGVASAD